MDAAVLSGGRETANPEELEAANREKQHVASLSVAVALGLTFFKLIVGVMTGSLGILAEAAHSGLDLVAAFVTLLAVRFSSRPADESHQFGHGKVENLSALFETFLLLVTCVWIVHEAIQRLFYKTVVVEPSIWAFIVMFTSLGALVYISRRLYAAAKKYHSQALEADGLHFRTDIWSTIVVILGLFFVLLGDLTGRQDLFGKADALAALFVAVIVVIVSLELGKRTVDALIDAAPPGMADGVKAAVQAVHGVDQVRSVRVRRAGPQTFVDIVVGVGRSLPLAETHAVASAVEDAAHTVAANADVMVHTDPHDDIADNVMRQVHLVADRMRLAVHNISIQNIRDQVYVTLDLEVDDRLTLGEGHAIAHEFEQRVRQEIPGVTAIDTHIEPRSHAPTSGQNVTGKMPEVTAAIAKALQGVPLLTGHHRVTVLRTDGHLNISLHCTFDPKASLRDVHDVTDEMRKRILAAVPACERVTIHTEP